MAPARGIVVFILAVLAAAFTVVAFSTLLYQATAPGATPLGTSGDLDVDWWYRCSRSGDDVAICVKAADKELDCTERKNNVRTLQAFYVLTAILVVLTLMAASADLLYGMAWHSAARHLPGRPHAGDTTTASGRPHDEFESHARKLRNLLLLLASLLFLVSLVAWALAVAQPYQSFCDEGEPRDLPDFKYQPSPFFMIATMVTAFLMIPALLALHWAKRHGRDPATVYPVDHHVPYTTVTPGATTTTQPVTTTTV